MSDIEVEQLTIPTALDDSPAARDFADTIDVRNAAETRAYGTDELRYEAAELLPLWQDVVHEPKRLYGVRIEGRMVARGVMETRPDDSEAADTAWVQVQVHPDFERRGVGRALADRLEQVAREEGRRQLHAYVISPRADGPRVEPPTGFGWVPAQNREVRFLLARGWELAQVERGSRLRLPVEPAALDVRRAAAQAKAVGYRVHTWVERAPERWVADMPMLATRMSTDAPAGGLDEPEDVWTLERWLDMERAHESSPRTTLYAVVEHEATGRLVGYTELSVPAETHRPVDQGDTIVLREHRGHRLGMLLKLANIEFLETTFPGHPAILTFNAEENRPMLDVNEAVGFVPFGFEGAWHLTL